MNAESMRLIKAKIGKETSMLRALFIKMIARALRLPPVQFELLSVAPSEFDKLPTVNGFPSYMDWEKVKLGMWPQPDRPLSVFVQP